MRAIIFRRIAVLSLIAVLPLTALTAAVCAEPSGEGILLAQARRSSRRRAKRDPVKERLTDISKVYKDRVAFAVSEKTAWDAFWKKIRDDRGQFEVRLDKQRSGFIDSLGSVPVGDHYRTLGDFEKLQRNMMASFEADLSARIQEFMATRLANLKEFGITVESERSRLELASLEVWEERKDLLQIEPPTKAELKTIERDQKSERKKERKKKKKRKRSLPVHEIF